MKKQAIEKLYTEKVAELLNAGWHINTCTMPGHQGEVAHIDLTNGSEIRRVLMTRESSWGEEFYGDKVVITVGRNTDELYRAWDSTIWNNHLEILFQIEFAEIQRLDQRHPDGWFIPLGEAGAIQQLRNARRAALRTQNPGHPLAQNRRDLGEAAKSIALRWLKRTQRGFKSAKPSDITRVIRVNRMEWDTPTPELQYYQIDIKGKSYRLCPPRKR